MTVLDADARRAQNYALYERLLASQTARDDEAFLACLAEDIVFEAPAYSPSGAPIAVGRDAMARMFVQLKEIFSVLDYQIKRFIPAVDPDLVLVEVKGNNEVASNKNRYQNNYLFLVGCRDGKIASIFEYSNPKVYSSSVDG